MMWNTILKLSLHRYLKNNNRKIYKIKTFKNNRNKTEFYIYKTIDANYNSGTLPLKNLLVEKIEKNNKNKLAIKTKHSSNRIYINYDYIKKHLNKICAEFYQTV